MLESLVKEAVVKFGGQSDGMFNSAAFGSAIKKHFDLQQCPDGRWVSRVMLGLPYVVPMPGGCHWLYRPVARHRLGQ